MKTHIIRNTRVGVSNVASVFAQKTTTWALELAQEDQLARKELLKKQLLQQKELEAFLASENLTKEAAEETLQQLADTYNICLK